MIVRRRSSWGAMMGRGARNRWVWGIALAVALALDGAAVFAATAKPVIPGIEVPDLPDSVLARARSERRFALVIGNGDYKVSDRLSKSVQDAKSMKAALEYLGFTVVSVTNGTKKDMDDALRAFTDKLRGESSFSVFFYSGHGSQVDGDNYILPVDFTDDGLKADFRYNAVNMSYVTAMIRDANPMGSTVIAVDACRRNKFIKGIKGAAQGLAPMSAKGDKTDGETLIAMATEPGNYAYEGDSGPHSLFTAGILREMFAPGKNVIDIFTNVRRRVFADSRKQQSPTVEAFGGERSPLLAPPACSPEDEDAGWNKAMETDTAAAYRQFAERCSDNPKADLARRQAAKIEKREREDTATRTEAEARARSTPVAPPVEDKTPPVAPLVEARRAVQLGIYQKPGVAWWAWKSVESDRPELATGLEPIVTPLDPARPDADVALRAIVPAGIDTAELCRRMVSAGLGCLRVDMPVNPKPSENRLSAKSQAGTVFRDPFTDGPGSGPELVVVEAGSYLMGSPANEAERNVDEGPRHKVTIGYTLGVGRYEVTFAEWDACVAGGGCGGYRPKDEGWGRDRRPVINVSWNDARGYVEWLSRKTGKTYRLLSESEWEFSARAGTTKAFGTGDRITSDQANFNGDSTFNGRAAGVFRGKTVEVGSFPANGFGLYDMHGNVSEWVEDCWHKSYEKPSPAPTDGSAWTSACSDNRFRVARGGSWIYAPTGIRAASRDKNGIVFRLSFFGFRVARTVTP